MTLRLTPELNEQLSVVAKEQGVSMQAAVVTAIAEFIERRNVTIIDDFMDSFMDENAELMDRLSK